MAVNGKPGDGADPLYAGAMASVEAICEVIEQRLDLGEKGKERQAGSKARDGGVDGDHHEGGGS